MATKIFSFLCGLIFLFFGICGLFSSLVYSPPDRLRFYEIHMIGQWGFLFTWMPVNLVHDVIYIAIGAGGVLMAVTFASAVAYSRGVFAITLLFAIVGLLPFGIAQLWGLLPLFGWNIMLHTVIAILAYYYGFVYPLDLGARPVAASV